MKLQLVSCRFSTLDGFSVAKNLKLAIGFYAWVEGGSDVKETLRALMVARFESAGDPTRPERIDVLVWSACRIVENVSRGPHPHHYLLNPTEWRGVDEYAPDLMGIETRNEVLRRVGASLHGDTKCTTCNLHSMGREFPTCPQCRMCEECNDRYRGKRPKWNEGYLRASLSSADGWDPINLRCLQCTCGSPVTRASCTLDLTGETQTFVNAAIYSMLAGDSVAARQTLVVMTDAIEEEGDTGGADVERTIAYLRKSNFTLRDLSFRIAATDCMTVTDRDFPNDESSSSFEHRLAELAKYQWMSGPRLIGLRSCYPEKPFAPGQDIFERLLYSAQMMQWASRNAAVLTLRDIEDVTRDNSGIRQELDAWCRASTFGGRGFGMNEKASSIIVDSITFSERTAKLTLVLPRSAASSEATRTDIVADLVFSFRSGGHDAILRERPIPIADYPSRIDRDQFYPANVTISSPGRYRVRIANEWGDIGDMMYLDGTMVAAGAARPGQGYGRVISLDVANGTAIVQVGAEPDDGVVGMSSISRVRRYDDSPIDLPDSGRSPEQEIE